MTLRKLASWIDPVPRSVMMSCFIEKRPQDPCLIEFRGDDTVVIFMNGYTIAPTESVGIPSVEDALEGKP